MPENTINCQNLTCPEPVIKVKQYLESQQPLSLVVIVDNQPANENVTRLLKSYGYTVSGKHKDMLQYLEASKDTLSPMIKPSVADTLLPDEKVLVVIASECLGSGDDILGQELMKNFIRTLPELGSSLWRIIFLNTGVKLCTSSSPVLEVLQELQGDKASIFACGACLEHFGLFNEKAVGETTNMLDIVTSMQLADKVLRP